jgi:ABC-type histidine transport system ATPase subunit
VVAVDTDPNALIFNYADFGIVGDLFQIVPALTEELKKADPQVIVMHCMGYTREMKRKVMEITGKNFEKRTMAKMNLPRACHHRPLHPRRHIGTPLIGKSRLTKSGNDNEKSAPTTSR